MKIGNEGNYSLGLEIMITNDKKTLDIPGIFQSDADDIRKARETAIRVHGTDIRAAGNEVEISVRDYFKRMLPPRYYVTQGHLIDANSRVSSQFDIIIADNFNLPSLMTTKDGTEYVPIDSVYAIGEVKSTYYKSEDYVRKFSEVLEDIRERLFHKEILNTAYEGFNGTTIFRDIALAKNSRIFNRIFAFMLFVDSGNLEFDDIKDYYTARSNKYLPNLTVALNTGTIVFGSLNDERFTINGYPEDQNNSDDDWYFYPFSGYGSGSMEGNHLGYLYYSLVEHLANSYLEPPSLSGYMAKMMVGRRSLTKKAKTAISPD